MCGRSIKYIMSQLSSDRQGKGSKGDLKTVLCFFSGLHFEEKKLKKTAGHKLPRVVMISQLSNASF